MFLTTNRSFIKLFDTVKKRAKDDVWYYRFVLKSQHSPNSKHNEVNDYDEAVQFDLCELKLLINMQKEHVLIYGYNKQLLVKANHLYNQLGNLTGFHLLDILGNMQMLFDKLIPHRTLLTIFTEALYMLTD